MMNRFLRKAEMSDCDLIYCWANDEETRRNSFQTEPISYETHVKWFDGKMSSPMCDIYIYMVDSEPAGQIRIDYQGDVGTISYSVAKEYRRQGNGVRMLKLIEEEPDVRSRIKKLSGEVKCDNIASTGCFEQCGYKKAELEEHIEYIKILEQE